jgi:hypothetical protein
VNAIDDALQKRGGESWLLAISQAYFDYDTMLAETHQAALKHPKLRVERDGCLRSSRTKSPASSCTGTALPTTPTSRTRRSSAPATRSRRARRRGHRRRCCGRARRGRLAPAAREPADARVNSWLATGVWARLLADDVRIPVGADIYLGIDAAYKGDTTAVGVAWRGPTAASTSARRSGRRSRRTRRTCTCATTSLDNEELVEPYIHELAKKYTIKEIVFDEQYFVTEAKHLGRAGFTIAPMYP